MLESRTWLVAPERGSADRSLLPASPGLGNEAPETSALLQHLTLQPWGQKSQGKLGGLAGAQSSTLELRACDLGCKPCLQHRPKRELIAFI